jgi:hypothetical protein
MTASLTRIRIRIGLAPWIRIRNRIEVNSWIRIRIENNADPQHCKNIYYVIRFAANEGEVRTNTYVRYCTAPFI